MKKVLVLIIAALAMVMICAGCDPDTPMIEDQAATQSVPNPWNGTYEGIETLTGKKAFVATISEEHINIEWTVADDQTALYWSGTFPWRFDSTQITSTANTNVMQLAPLASLDLAKLFTYEDNSWTFNATVLGITKTFHLQTL